MNRKIKMIKSICAVTLIITMVGCSKDESKIDSRKETQAEVKGVKDESLDKGKEDKKEVFSIYNHIIDLKYRTDDVALALRNPVEYENNTFSICGEVVKTKTNEDGNQVVTMETFNSEYLSYVTGDRYTVEVVYNPSQFDNQRILENDNIAFGAIFKEIKTDEEHGDVLKFEATSRLNIMDYLSTMALDDYFDSIGIDSQSMNLELLEVEELENLVDEYAYDEYITTSNGLSLLKTNTDTYWLCSLSIYEEDSINIMSAKVNDSGKVDGFESKGIIRIGEYKV